MKTVLLPLAALACIACIACREPRVAEIVRDLRGPEYVRSVETPRHRIQVRHVPSALQALGGPGIDSAAAWTAALRDSLRAGGRADGGIAFVLTLAPLDTTARGYENDVVYGTLGGHANYKEALEAYTFGLKEKIWIEHAGRRIPMGSYSMENTFGMTRGRNFFLVFPQPPGGGAGSRLEFELVLDDIVPGMARTKLNWKLPLGKYDAIL